MSISRDNGFITASILMEINVQNWKQVSIQCFVMKMVTMESKRRWHACCLWSVWGKSVMYGSGRRGDECHMTRRGWDSLFCWGCIRHEFPNAGLHNKDDESALCFVVLLFCSWQMAVHSPSRSVFYITTYHEDLQVPRTSRRLVMWKGGYRDYWAFYRKN
jgi:hypothetical protein